MNMAKNYSQLTLDQMNYLFLQLKLGMGNCMKISNFMRMMHIVRTMCTASANLFYFLKKFIIIKKNKTDFNH